MTELVGATLDEPGCIEYRLLVSSSDPAVFVTVETWRDEAAVEAHMKSDHVKQCIRAAGPHVAGAPVVHHLTPIA